MSDTPTPPAEDAVSETPAPAADGAVREVLPAGTIEVRTTGGDSIGTLTLDEAVFGVQVNVPVMHQVVVAQLAAARSGTHSTKTRGDVSGGGKKPWRQKGTGRARQGSTRAPQWSGGGVALGPHPRDHTKSVPKKMKALALRSALSDRARIGRVAVVDGLSFDTPKTREAAQVLDALELDGLVLVVLEGPNQTVGKSFRNIMRAHLITVDQLNTYDVLESDWVLFTKAALERLVSGKTFAKPDADESGETSAPQETEGVG